MFVHNIDVIQYKFFDAHLYIETQWVYRATVPFAYHSSARYWNPCIEPLIADSP